MIKHEAIFDGPLINDRGKSYNRYKFLNVENFENTRSVTIEVAEPDGRQTRYTLSVATGYLLKRESLGSEGEVLLETLYSDYREVKGFPFAFVVENRVNGELANRTEIKRVIVNPGILGFYFKKPLD